MAFGASAMSEFNIAIRKPASRFVSCNASTVCCKEFVAADSDCASWFKLLICCACSPIVFCKCESFTFSKRHSAAKPVANDHDSHASGLNFLSGSETVFCGGATCARIFARNCGGGFTTGNAPASALVAVLKRATYSCNSRLARNFCLNSRASVSLNAPKTCSEACSSRRSSIIERPPVGRAVSANRAGCAP